MVAITSGLQPALSNRRRRVRHKIQTPAYATFTAESRGVMLDLHEIVNLSEDGVAIQCHSRLEVNQKVGLCLDLAGCSEQIYTSSQVIWTNSTGRAGLRFVAFPPDALARLREWLFANVMAGVANNEEELTGALLATPPTPNYTDTLAAITAVQRQAETLGADFSGALQLIVERAQTMVRASGAAIALSDTDPDFMICRACSGADAPPVGARLHVGSGFSGECVRKGVLLRCDDTDVDPRVDRESCRVLGIRSILAAPVRAAEKIIGLVEVFSPRPFAFLESDERVLQKLADAVFTSAARALRDEGLSISPEPSAKPFVAPQGSVLFASADAEAKPPQEKSEEIGNPNISLPRSYLLLLTFAAAAISLSLGLISAPWIQSSVAPWIKNKIRARRNTQLQTVLASTKAPASSSASPSIETATFDQLSKMAEAGNSAAQNALGLRYSQGDPIAGIRQNELEAARWFTTAAEHGNVAAQSKLGFLFWSGRGVPKDLNRAYLWTLVACNNPSTPQDPAVVLSHTLARVLRQQMTAEQSKAIEKQAIKWLRQYETGKAETAQIKQPTS